MAQPMILESTLKDVDDIYELYRQAREYQKSRFHSHWPIFDKALVPTEIGEHRQWKMLVDERIACIWAITFSDPEIWEERNADPAIYIHRIATHPDFKGQAFVEKIVEWAKGFAAKNGKEYIRLDTVSENLKLIEHYTRWGFHFLGLVKLKDTTGLPAHYHDAVVSLFELKA